MRLTLAALLFFLTATTVQAFTIDDIRIRGLERISEGTVLNYLPLEVGDEVDGAASADALEALFDTGFFDDVELLRDGTTLIVEVRERPAIAQIEFSGNEQLDGDLLREGLADAGLGEGQSFDRSLLARIELPVFLRHTWPLASDNIQFHESHAVWPIMFLNVYKDSEFKVLATRQQEVKLDPVPWAALPKP